MGIGIFSVIRREGRFREVFVRGRVLVLLVGEFLEGFLWCRVEDIGVGRGGMGVYGLWFWGVEEG